MGTKLTVRGRNDEEEQTEPMNEVADEPTRLGASQIARSKTTEQVDADIPVTFWGRTIRKLTRYKDQMCQIPED